MNPPSALAGAMGRERKPFTYTPGGLDLSEIKSERMAKRLMRNAMNQGVPETPTHTAQSPPASSTTAVMPNYNCLPVQVFPTFPLPVNPKTLLRTRSYPDPNEKLLNLSEKPKLMESSKGSDLNKVIATNNTLPPTYEYNNANNLFYNYPLSYDSSEYTAPVFERYDEKTLDKNTARQLNTQDIEVEKSNINNIRPVYFNVAPKTSSIKPDYGSNVATINIPLEDIEQINNKKEEVSVLDIQSKSDDITENKNGDTNAVITLNLPTKKSEAKTETKVEVVKKTLPDGAIQEVKTTTTKTTIDGRTEITTETETTTFPIDDGEDVEYEVEEEEIEESDEKEENNDNKVTENGNSKKEEDEGVQEIEEEPTRNNGQIITQDEKLELSTTKKVMIIQSELQNSDAENEEEYDDADEPEDVEVEEVVILKQKTTNTNSDGTQNEENKQTNKDENKKEDDKNINDCNTKEVNIIQNGHEEIECNGEDEEEEIEEEEVSEHCDEVDNIEKEVAEQESEQLAEEVEEEYEEAEEAEKAEEPKKCENIEDTAKAEETEKAEESEKAEETEKAEEAVKTNIEPENEKCNKNIETNPEEKSEAEQKLGTDDIKILVKDIPIKIITETEKVNEINEQNKEGINQENQALPSKINISLTEPSVPLDKVEEVEIKPIGPAKEVITKTHTEIITKTSDKPVGTHSTQTEYNIVENIVTVNRTTKTLDHAYEEIPDNVPTIKTMPPTSDINFRASPQPVLRSYQPVFEPESQTERRHSLLLERISMDRQMPSEIYQNNYQNNNQAYEDKQYLQEPQSEILVVSNVKPSTISKNQQWYQQNETENVSHSNTIPSTDIYSNQQHWQNTQPQYKPQTKSQTFYKPKPQTQSTLQTTYQPQPRVEPSPQPIYQVPPQTQHTPQPIYQPKPQTEPIYRPQPQVNPKSQPIYQTQPQPTVQPNYDSQPQLQQNYLDNSSQETYKYSSSNYEQTTYPSYHSKPIWTGKIVDSQSLPNSQSNHSYLQKDSTESFQKSSQHFSSSYVPPPWEQDCNYAVDNSMQSFYQPPPPKTTFTTSSDWKPSKPTPKFTKSTPTAYIPPAPNQSFVKTANTVEPPKQQGRKTYYSEYERRYISVPETTYIPNETKFQPQPDPSPQYFYDNNEPAEVVEPQWRKELREFKEQSSKITLQTEQSNVRPPWEDDPKYTTPKDFASTPTWTQTLKPRSWRERSFEPEYIGTQELPKTNTLGRGRPQSSYVKNNFDRVPDRTRGVSVDRYNPNNYQSPMTREHPPPASHILDPIVQGKTYHNPNVPAYHSRASAEPREQPVTYQQPRQRESRATPVQSRSFKYLQWITGTDD